MGLRVRARAKVGARIGDTGRVGIRSSRDTNRYLKSLISRVFPVVVSAAADKTSERVMGLWWIYSFGKNRAQPFTTGTGGSRHPIQARVRGPGWSV